MKRMMQTDTFGTQPLSEEALREVSGGFCWLPLIGPVLGGVIGEIISDWDNFKRGIAGLPEK